jgi:hypothetical protein
MDGMADLVRNERAIPRRLITHLFTKLPLESAQAAIGRLVETALPGPVDWYLAHAGRSLRALADALTAGVEIAPGCCDCMVSAPGPGCDVGQALFRVSANHRARRSA